jgi:hypothetical protein
MMFGLGLVSLERRGSVSNIRSAEFHPVKIQADFARCTNATEPSAFHDMVCRLSTASLVGGTCGIASCGGGLDVPSSTLPIRSCHVRMLPRLYSSFSSLDFCFSRHRKAFRSASMLFTGLVYCSKRSQAEERRSKAEQWRSKVESCSLH